MTTRETALLVSILVQRSLNTGREDRCLTLLQIHTPQTYKPNYRSGKSFALCQRNLVFPPSWPHMTHSPHWLPAFRLGLRRFLLEVAEFLRGQIWGPPSNVAHRERALRRPETHT